MVSSVIAQHCASFRTIDIVFSCTLLFIFFIIVSPFDSNLISRLYSNGVATSLRKRCEFPLVYNKPSKTSSTYIKNVMKDWAKTERRPFFECGSSPHETAARLQDCVKKGEDGCGVLACHVHLHPTVTSILQQRLPNYRLITSTRYPPHRIISHYLQRKKKKVTQANDITKGLRKFLLSEYNPSGVLAWHTGVLQRRTCPISEEEQISLYNIVSKYYIVIDVNLKNESNVILNHFGLFSLPDDAPHSNVRRSTKYRPPEDIRQLLRNVSCYEHAIHKALQMRMASIYEKITQVECVQKGRIGRISSCLAERERLALGDTWIY